MDAALLPPHAAAWIQAVVDGPVPAETHATCSSCAMCAPVVAMDAPAAPGRNYFEPDIKCCDYLPDLPNFLVGRVLLDDSEPAADGRASIGARIDAGAAVTPLGLGTPEPWKLLTRGRESDFDQSRAMRCPHFVEDGNTCGIWAHRESVCSTYFCRHVRGATGESFWMALREMLVAIERDLAQWCVEQIGIDEASHELLFSRTERFVPVDHRAPDGSAGARRHRAIWGSWLGRERELYERSARLVAELGWEEVLEIGGSELGARTRVVQAAWRRLASLEVPKTLRIGRYQVVDEGVESVTLRSYSASDLLEIPRALFEALPAFDGRPTAQVLEGIEQERGVRMGADRVRELVDFRVLLPERVGGGHPGVVGPPVSSSADGRSF